MQDHQPTHRPPDGYLTKAQLAKHLGVCRRTINNLMAIGLPHLRFNPRLVRFAWPDVNRWIQENYRSRRIGPGSRPVRSATP